MQLLAKWIVNFTLQNYLIILLLYNKPCYISFLFALGNGDCPVNIFHIIERRGCVKTHPL